MIGRNHRAAEGANRSRSGALMLHCAALFLIVIGQPIVAKIKNAKTKQEPARQFRKSLHPKFFTLSSSFGPTKARRSFPSSLQAISPPVSGGTFAEGDEAMKAQGTVRRDLFRARSLFIQPNLTALIRAKLCFAGSLSEHIQSEVQ
jgi:hypothetical protein